MTAKLQLDRMTPLAQALLLLLASWGDALALLLLAGLALLIGLLL